MPEEPTIHLKYEGNGQGRNVIFPNGDSESLRVSSISSDLFRLEDSSLLGHACYHDVIRASVRDDGALEMHQIVSPSGLKTQIWVLSLKVLESDDCRELLDYVLSVGGHWERAFGGLLLLHMPPHLAKTIDSRLKALLSRFGI